MLPLLMLFHYAAFAASASLLSRCRCFTARDMPLLRHAATRYANIFILRRMLHIADTPITFFADAFFSLLLRHMILMLPCPRQAIAIAMSAFADAPLFFAACR